MIFWLVHPHLVATLCSYIPCRGNGHPLLIWSSRSAQPSFLVQHQLYIWAIYYTCLTWIKGILGGIPFLATTIWGDQPAVWSLYFAPGSCPGKALEFSWKYTRLLLEKCNTNPTHLKEKMGSIECILQLNCVSIYMLPLLIQKHAKYTPGQQDSPLKKCCFEDYFLSAFWELFREKPWNFGCRISQLNPSCWKSRGTFSFLQSSSMGAKYNRHLAVHHRDVQAPHVRLQKSIERQIFFTAANWRLKKHRQFWDHRSGTILMSLSEWLSPFSSNNHPP